MNFGIRVRLVFAMVILVVFALTLRLAYWQIGSSARLSALADAQHFSTFEIPAMRGEVKAADGSNLVTNQPSNLLFANLTKIKASPVEIAQTLAPILAETIPIIATDSSKEKKEAEIKDDFEKILTTKDAVWVALFHKVDNKTKNTIDNLKIAGLEFAAEPNRFYPEASMAAQLLGITGSDQNGSPQGYFGLEGYYNRELAGRPGLRRVERDAMGLPIAIGSDTTVLSQDGRTLVTSIDRYVQKVVENYLAEGIKTWGATAGSVIVMEPSTGRILAMSSFPSFDPANYTYYSQESFQNPAISQTYEPGSIFKPLVMAAAVNEGKVTSQTTCDQCSGPRYIGGGVIRTFDDNYHPGSTMTEVLKNSDNTGMVFVGEKLGENLLLDYLNKYELGKKTNIDLEGEEVAVMKKFDQWYALDLATATFGQGIAATPIQIVRAFATLANGGYLVTPQVVTKIIDNNRTIEIAPKIGPQILKTETTKTLTEMLVGVNQESPLHFPRDRIPDLARFKIAAKSGTAQIPISGHYEQGKTIGSVIGFAPADNPKFLVLVKLDEPSVRSWGSDTAGPIFYNIVHDLLLYYGISP